MYVKPLPHIYNPHIMRLTIKPDYVMMGLSILKIHLRMSKEKN